MLVYNILGGLLPFNLLTVTFSKGWPEPYIRCMYSIVGKRITK